MQDIEKDLIQKASAGDIRAFEEIYKISCGFVYSVAFRIVMNKNDAEDITQEVFIKIYENLKKFESRSSLKTWAYRITVNTAINFIKRVKKNNEKTFTGDAIEVAALKAENDFNSLKSSDCREIFEHLLGFLNSEQRACVVLREIEGLSYMEIARALNVNINTVRSRLKRARETMLYFNKKEVF